MIQDSVATFYGGYDQARFIRPTRLHVPLKALAVAVASITLLAFVAADVSALESRPAIVQVTSVNWYVESYPLTTSAGFSMHSSQTVTLSLTCSSYCFRFSGVASVSLPFHLLSFTVTYAPIQYANATVQAPGSGYDGPLTITLGVP